MGEDGRNKSAKHRHVMLLHLPPEWVFSTPGPLPEGAVDDFFDLAVLIADQGDSWTVLELFKAAFGSRHRSSSASWALSDLRDAMTGSADNAPSFIATFWRAYTKVR